MSDIDKIERFKRMVDAIIDSMDETETKIKEQVSPKQAASGMRKLNERKLERELDKEIVVDPSTPQAEVLELALEELDIVREAFLNFQEQIGDLAIFQFIYPEIEEFVEFCLDLVELVEDDFDVETLQGKTLEQYQKIQKLRARILSAMYMKYKKKD